MERGEAQKILRDLLIRSFVTEVELPPEIEILLAQTMGLSSTRRSGRMPAIQGGRGDGRSGK